MHLVGGNDLVGSSSKKRLPESNKGGDVTPLLPKCSSEEGSEEVGVRLGEFRDGMKLEQLREDLEDVGDEFCRGRKQARSALRFMNERNKVGLTDNVVLEDSHDGSEEGALELRQRRRRALSDESEKSQASQTHRHTFAVAHEGEQSTHRMRADTASNVYWLNLGLLGFLLISPTIPTRCWSTTEYTGVRL